MQLHEVGNRGLPLTSFRTCNSNPFPSQQQQPSLKNTDDDDVSTRIPLVNDPTGIYSALVTDSDMALTKRKFVKVSSVGEVEVSPDRIEFCIQISCTKSDMASAKESIRKRDDFIMLALKKLGIAANCVSTTSMVKRFKGNDDNNEDQQVLANGNFKGQDLLSVKEHVQVVKELYTICDTLHKYMEVSSIINEKLDNQVKVSTPVVRFSPEWLQCQTRAASKLAMKNAICKAKEVLQSENILRATVGKLFYSVEDFLTVSEIPEYQDIANSTEFESLRWKKNNKLIVCKLTSLFEVNNVRPRRVL